MGAPFEKFVVHSSGVNGFYIYVASPEAVRKSMADIEEFKKSNEEPNVGKLMMERYLFIEQAIQEKLDREQPVHP